ncbi:hypothetical protein KM1_061590 [Entamoeba histolytica HM-3:IMSS]|nr:hypothetical protein KM1_061590 [Entamoeba histolytica HM-3:IMSS]
MKKVHNP